MKVVFIGSAVQELSLTQELFQISEKMAVSALVGPEVNLEFIARRTAGNRARILHIADHGDEHGVHLVNGETLTKERLAHIARQLRVDIVFLNACTSAYLGQYLVDQNIPAVIAYTVNVFDSDAFRIAAYYYEELDEHKNDFKRAYDHASPKDGTFAWFSDGKYTEGLLRPLLEKLAQLTKQLDDLRKQFASKERRLLVGAVGFMAFVLVLNILFWAVFIRSYSANAQTIPETMTICHNKTSTITIPKSAWPPHLRHGDTQGACSSETIPPLPTETPYSTSTSESTPTEIPSVTPIPQGPTETWTPIPSTSTVANVSPTVIVVPTSTNTRKPRPTSTNTPTQTPTIFVDPTRTSTPVIAGPTALPRELQLIVNSYLNTYGCTCSQQ